MPIELKVGSEFDEAAARRASAEAREYYKRQAATLEVQAKLAEKTAKEAPKELQVLLDKSAVTARVDAILNRDSAREVMREFERELKARQNPKIDVEAKVDKASAAKTAAEMKTFFKAQNANINVKVDTASAEQSFARLSNTVRRFSTVIENLGLTSTRGLAAGGPIIVTGLVGALVEVAGVAASAAQSLWLLPAAAGAAGAAVGTLALATSGFGQAIQDIGDPQKFAEDLQSLAPSAQQAALSIQQLMPAFTQLKNATQDALFAGIGQQLNQLTNQYLPTIQNMTTGIAGAFNQMFSGISSQLMTPETQASIQTFMNNVVSGFQKLTPALAPLTKALADIMAVGSGALPQLAQGAAVLAQKFSDFIEHAKETGELKRWLDEGLDTVKQLASAAYSLGQAFMELAPIGRDVLPDIVSFLKDIKNIMPEIGYAALLIGPNFGAMEMAIAPIAGMTKAISAAWKEMGPTVIPVINAITEAVNKLAGALSPILAVASLFGHDTNIPMIAQPGSDQMGGQGGTRSENRTSLPGNTAGLAPFTGSAVPGAAGLGGLGSSAFGLATVDPTKPGSWGPRGGLFADPAWVKGYHPKLGSEPSGGGSGGGSTPPPFIDPSQYQVGSMPTGGPSMFTSGQGQPQGYGGANVVDPQAVYAADSAQLRAKNNLEQDKLHLAILQKDNTTTQEQLLRAENQVAEDERAFTEAQFKYQEELQGKWKKASSDLNSSMGEIGVALDADLGISKGLPGLADNLVRFLASLAAAPILGQMSAMDQVSPSQGRPGLLGPVLDRFLGTGGPSSSATGLQQGYGFSSASNMGPSGLQAPSGYRAGPSGAGVPSPGGPGAEGWRNTVAGVVDKYGPQMGVTPGNRQKWIDAIVSQIGTESGGNAGADNPNDTNGRGGSQHVSGLLQYLPSSYAMSGGKLTGLPYMDPVGQIAGALFAPRDASGAPSPGGAGIGGGHGWGPVPTPIGSGGGGGGGGPSWFTGGPPAAPSPAPDGPGASSRLPTTGFAGEGRPNLGGPTPGADPNTGGPGHISGAGGWQPSGGGFQGLGGAPMEALNAAAGMVPGVGQGIQVGMKLANRAIGFAGQAAAIGVQGLFETFLPSGSDFADPTKSWIGKLAGGFAGARPAQPTSAGTAGKTQDPKKEADPNTKEHGKGQGQPPGPVVGTMNYTGPAADGQAVANDIDRQANAHGAGMGR